MSENDHKHHVPNPEDIVHIQTIREATIAYEKMIDELCPPGRDLSLAKTNLEQARMWAIAALVKPRQVEEHAQAVTEELPADTDPGPVPGEEEESDAYAEGENTAPASTSVGAVDSVDASVSVSEEIEAPPKN